MGLFRATMSALRKGLSTTRSALAEPLTTMRGRTVSAETIEELEHLLLSCDVGVTTTDAIIQDIRDAVSEGAMKGRDIIDVLREGLVARLQGKDRTLAIAERIIWQIVKD